MRFVTVVAAACVAFVTQAMADPGYAPGREGARKRTGAPVSSPNRIPSSQLPAGRPGTVQPAGSGPDGMVLVDAYGHPVGRPYPLNSTLTALAARFNGMNLLIDGAAGEADCDSKRCRFGPGLSWAANGNWLLLYASPDCSGRPEVSYRGGVAGFDAVAFPVREDEGSYMYLARNQPRDTWVRSYRNSGETVCVSEAEGAWEATLPLEGVYPTSQFGVAPMRWR